MRGVSCATLILTCIFSLILPIVSPQKINCKDGERLVQETNSIIESNGCSKPAFIHVNGEEDFTYCCDRHDACYATCGASKSFCDNDFGKCMQKLCDDFFSHNEACGRAAETYRFSNRCNYWFKCLGTIEYVVVDKL